MSIDRADSRDLPIVGRPPGQAPVVSAVDLLIVDVNYQAEAAELDAHPPAGDQSPVELGDGLRIERLPQELCELVRAACTPRGHYFIAANQIAARYGFVYEVPVADGDISAIEWDPEGALWQAVALSRLIVDNAHSTYTAGRVRFFDDGQQQVIPFTGIESHVAYSFDPTARDWLDQDEAGELAALCEAFRAAEAGLPERVKHALSTNETLVRLQFVDQRVPLLVSALEGLLNTSRSYVTRQFRARLPALAAELGVPEVTEEFAGDAYNARSQGFHGGRIAVLQAARHDEGVRMALALQTVLRTATRRAIEDPEFRATFDNRGSIRSRWPALDPEGNRL
jgi:hypothetical protein